MLHLGRQEMTTFGQENKQAIQQNSGTTKQYRRNSLLLWQCDIVDNKLNKIYQINYCIFYVILAMTVATTP